ncbi:nucleotidyltransferase domain-containing protein [Cohnella nanjingensis]|uniref:Nucleotidyltransferase family protein n=1 Tax=Cohnella nanjingensis TaxID=1387779 RepID=A0A7X0VF55_9BACL|nr:nucleotidyltransferase family protein [Cohnella nanjingensis]MBB6671456.1 nucleotidyltransferase family protein [Cohnella nanjingensis]
MNQALGLDMTAIPRELTAMLTALRSEAAPEEKGPPGPPLPNIDWNQFVKLVRHHRVYPQIHADPDGAGLIPSDVLQALSGDYTQNTWRMLRLSGELDRVSRSLTKRGVRSLALKGPALARQLYGDISLRTSKDLDILIPVDDLRQAERLLQELGYEADEPIPYGLGDWKWKIHHVSFTNPNTGIQVEVHWRLNGDNGKEPPFEALWRDRQACALSDGLHMPGDAHLFMYLVTHGARHGWFRLRWLADIDRMVRRGLDWEAIIPLLRRYHALDQTSQALVLADALLHTPVPAPMRPILAAGRGRALADRALGFIRDPVVLTTDPSAGEVSKTYKRYLFELKTTRQKWWYAVSRLYPSFRDAEALPLPRPLYFLYFPLRPFVWLWRQFRQQT